MLFLPPPTIILSAVLLPAALVVSLPFQETSLYTYLDPVNILYTSNVTDFISHRHQDGQKLQLVQFYSSWCGHCINFAPHFKEFLKSVRAWRHWLDISVLDCSVKENMDGACNTYDISYYPCLKMFWFKPDDTQKGNEIKLKGQDPEAIQKSILTWISQNWKQGGVPSDWPSMVPVTGGTLDELRKHIDWSEPNRPVVLVVEADDSFVGRQLIAHFFRWRKHVQIYRVVESDARLVDILSPNALDKFSLPFLFVAKNKDDSFTVVPRPLADSSEHYKYLRSKIESEFLGHIPEDELHEDDYATEHKEEKKLLGDAKQHTSYPDKVYMSDLHNAMRYALYHEVLLRPKLDVEQINALVRFLSVLYDNFPFPNGKTKEFIKKLEDWLTKTLNGLRQKPGGAHEPVAINTSEIKTTMDLYEEYYHFPEMKPWRACANIGEHLGREYPCSLWTLFHVLTVAEYRRSLDSGHWENLHPTLFAMRDYVQQFFSCKSCAEHFLAMAKDLEVTLTRSNSSALWLWSAHNKVNARLKGTGVDNPKAPKRQFPTFNECPYCYKTLPKAEDDEHLTDSNVNEYQEKYFKEAKVLQFLVTFYGAQRIIADDDEDGAQQKQALGDGNVHIANMLDHIDSKVKPKSMTRNMLTFSLFTSVDYSILILFYLVSAALLFGIYFLVKLRKNKRRKFNY